MDTRDRDVLGRKQLNLRLPLELYERLRWTAFRRRMSMQECIRKMLETGLDRELGWMPAGGEEQR